MAQPLLALQHRSGAAQQVYRIPGASPQLFGDPLPSAGIDGTTTDNMALTNRVIQFGGDVYAAAEGGVYKKDDPTSDTGPWSLDHAFTNQATSGTLKHNVFGPYQISLNGVSKLFVVWLTATAGAATWNAAILDGSTGLWSEVGEQLASAVSANEQTGAAVVYRGVLYVLLRTSGAILTFDPGAQSFGEIDGSLLDESNTAGFGIFNDRLLLLGRRASNGNASLFEVTSTVSLLFEITGPYAINGTPSENRHALFPSPDGTVLYGIVVTTTGGAGSVFLKFIDTAGTISFSTELTTPVLPAGVRPGSGLGTNRWWVFYDQETTPGTARCLLFFSSDGNAGSVVTQYRFVDEVTEIVQEDTGASAAWAFSTTMTGGGERIFTPGELNIEIINRVAVFGGEAVQFKCWGATGADKQVEFRFNSETEVPLTVATLIGTPTVVSGPAPAPTRSGNTLMGVTADGTTIYQTVWDVGTDGLVSGQRAQLVPRIFV